MEISYPPIFYFIMAHVTLKKPLYAIMLYMSISLYATQDAIIVEEENLYSQLVQPEHQDHVQSNCCHRVLVGIRSNLCCALCIFMVFSWVVGCYIFLSEIYWSMDIYDYVM